MELNTQKVIFKNLYFYFFILKNVFFFIDTLSTIVIIYIMLDLILFFSECISHLPLEMNARNELHFFFFPKREMGYILLTLIPSPDTSSMFLTLCYLLLCFKTLHPNYDELI